MLKRVIVLALVLLVSGFVFNPAFAQIDFSPTQPSSSTQEAVELRTTGHLTPAAHPQVDPGPAVVLECPSDGTNSGSGGDIADLRGIRFTADQDFSAAEVRMAGGTAGIYTVNAQLQRSTGFVDQPAVSVFGVLAEVPDSEAGTPFLPVQFDFGTISVTGAETFTLKFEVTARPEGDDTRLFFETFGIGAEVCDNVEETDENDVANPTVRSDPAGFRVLDAGDIAGGTEQSDFLLRGEHSVPFELFNVLTPGLMRLEVDWEGASDTLAATLTGRRRPALPDPTTPYAQDIGTSPLTFLYNVSQEDVERGVGWRLALTDETGNGDATGMITITRPVDLVLNDAFEDEKVSLRSGDLWPSVALQTQFMTNLTTSPLSSLHGIITLSQACDCYQARALERHGIVRQSFMSANNSYGAIRKGVNLAHPDISELVQFITPLDPEDKIDPNILLGNLAGYHVTQDEISVNHVMNGDGTVELTIIFASDVPDNTIDAILAAETLAASSMAGRQWQVTVDAASIVDLAAYDEVEWIDAGPVPGLPDNNTTRQFINVSPVQQANINAGANTATYNGLSGNGVTIGIQDNGIDSTHPDLVNVVAVVNNNTPAGSHGTHVAGIAAGTGVNSNTVDADGDGNPDAAFQWRGMAPQAGLIDASNLDDTDDFFTATQNSLDVANRSQSVSFDGNYNAENNRVDQIIRGAAKSGVNDVPRRPMAYSAGNHGFAPFNQRPPNPTPPASGGPAVATVQNFAGGQIGYFAVTKQTKNTIVVGNWDPYRNLLNPSSSFGPTYDGRIKPDVVAPGTNVTSTGTGATANAYRASSGTSMATPAVTGVMALMLEAWQNTYSTPLGTTIDDSPPLPSTLRAILIQTAQDIVSAAVTGFQMVDVDADSTAGNANDGTGAPQATVGPDFTTGWGLVNAQAAVQLVQDSRLFNDIPIPNRIVQDSLQQGDAIEYEFVVDNNLVGSNVQVTLAWDDVEGAVQNASTTPLLVNDLDLELVAPDGTISYPWQLAQTIQDVNGNVLANNAQPPGTNIQVVLPVTPINNPTFNWVVQNCTTGCTTQWSTNFGAGASAGNVDYVPANVFNAGGGWVAAPGKDHLNNVEVVTVQNVQAGQVGRWRARVIGFNIPSGAQDFSVVGFPYPDLPDLVSLSDEKVGLPGLDQDITFDWKVRNVGRVDSAGTFEYEVLLSTDFVLGDDVVLADTNQLSLGPVVSGGTVEHTSTVQISQADVDALLGAGSTFQDLLDADVFLLVRVDSDDDVLEHNETNLTFVQMARLVDAVLVMDRSGSMTGQIPVSNGNQSKLQVLQDSASLFLDLMRLDAGDRLSEVSFSGDIGADSITTDFGHDLISAANIGDAQDAVDALIANGFTDIRGALQRALDLMPGAADNEGFRRVVIFFSDGEATTGGDPSDPAFLQQFDDEDINVYSVGFGTEGGSGSSSIDAELLATLANTGAQGFFQVTESPVGLDKFFVNALAGAVDSQVVIDPIADLPPGESDTVRMAISEQDYVVTFVLTWDNPGHDLLLTVWTPSGQKITAGNAATFSDNVQYVDKPAYKLVKVRLPVAMGPVEEHGGTWKMEIMNPSFTTSRYAATAIAQTTVRADVQPPQAPGPAGFLSGDSVNWHMQLTQIHGAPVSNAAVTVTPNVPLVSVGNILSSGIIGEEDLFAVPEQTGGEDLSLRERMLTALQNTLGSNPLTRVELEPFTLNEGSPGTYTGSFTETLTPGVYGFTVRSNALVDDCGEIDREGTHSINVGLDIDPVTTRIRVVGTGPDLFTVVVTPLDGNGNFLGPGFADAVLVTTVGLAPTGPVNDELNGTYAQELTVDGGGVATVDVTVQGVPLPQQTVDTGVPVPSVVVPGGGRNDVGTTIVVSVGGGTSVAQVTAISIVGNGIDLDLGNFAVNVGDNSVKATVPSSLPPDKYEIVLKTNDRKGATASGGTYTVVGRGQDFPDYVEQLRGVGVRLLAAKSDKEGLILLEELIKRLVDAPIDRAFTKQDQKVAVTEIARLLALKRGLVSENDIPGTLRAINLGKIDSRDEKKGSVDTNVGDDVENELGNGTKVRFGQVSGGGTTKLTLKPGPEEFDKSLRGDPYVAYDIETTAVFGANRGVKVTIEYEEGDFEDESDLRLFHNENGTWVDRTTAVDPVLNVVTADVTGFSDFVVLSGFPDVTVCGDLNDDTEVNVLDVIQLLRVLVGKTVADDRQQTVGDVVQDGKLNVVDGILLIRHVVGLAQIDGCGEPTTNS